MITAKHFPKKALAVMVYVRTLSVMHSLTATHSASSAVQVTLDWSNLFTVYPSRDTHTQIPFLLQWISAYPDRRNVRVYLGAAVRHHEHRRLKNSLQSLGCTVTAKSSAYESPMRFADDTILIDRSNLLVDGKRKDVVKREEEGFFARRSVSR